MERVQDVLSDVMRTFIVSWEFSALSLEMFETLPYVICLMLCSSLVWGKKKNNKNIFEILVGYSTRVIRILFHVHMHP
jgi:hypothetical protein